MKLTLELPDLPLVKVGDVEVDLTSLDELRNMIDPPDYNAVDLRYRIEKGLETCDLQISDGCTEDAPRIAGEMATQNEPKHVPVCVQCADAIREHGGEHEPE